MTADSPAIIAFGRRFIAAYPVDEYEDALRRAFGADPTGFVFLDSFPYRQRFLAACAAWAIDQGFLCVDRIDDDGQSEVCSLRLTEAGMARYRHSPETSA